MTTLWVRSQDRNKLVCNPSLEVEDCYIFDRRTPYLILGEYETKEKCIEILEEIQLSILRCGTGGTIFYKMPLED